MPPQRVVLVFLKWPQPGRVKTRLAADLGDTEAAGIYRHLVESTAATLERAPIDEIRVFFDPPERESEIRRWLEPRFAEAKAGTLTFHPQTSGDLGHRLHTAFESVFREKNDARVFAAAIGTDCLEIDPATFEKTWAAFEANDADAVIGPARDGGYYLIGLDRIRTTLFAGIPWSTDQVLPATFEKAAAAGLRVSLLDSKRDIDTLADWKNHRTRKPHLPTPISHLRGEAAKGIMDAIVFEPTYQTRVWGGRNLETRFGRTLPDPDSPYGESWEISGRPEAESRVARGFFAGKTLNELWRGESRKAIFGPDAPFEASEHFPLLCKILDARETLSLQVHPPAGIARELGGESKNECWFVADAEPGAHLYAGLKAGVARDRFAAALEAGTAEKLTHRIPVAAGDFIFIPSGRLHAIGAGIVLYEIQQNSDTTYRVFDWNRTGLDGRPRALHIPESLRCIDFDDVEPRLGDGGGGDPLLAECDSFRVECHRIADDAKAGIRLPASRFAIITVVRGTVSFGDDLFGPGDFFLVPAAAATDSERAGVLRGEEDTELLLTTWPT